MRVGAIKLACGHPVVVQGGSIISRSSVTYVQRLQNLV